MKYQLLWRCPVTQINGHVMVPDHGEAVASARARHRQGEHVTVVNTENGNVVLWCGTNLHANPNN
jgi:hypothetical protein